MRCHYHLGAIKLHILLNGGLLGYDLLGDLGLGWVVGGRVGTGEDLT